MEGPRPYVRRERPHEIVHLPARQVPPDHRFFTREFRGICSIDIVLVREGNRTSFNGRQNLYYSFSPQVRKEFGEFAACHVRGYLDGALEGDWAGIEALVHTHYGNAGLGLAVHNGAFYGGGAAILWQE